jgi:hypothetical protein
MESQKDANEELKASLFSGINIEKGKNMWRYSGSRIACPKGRLPFVTPFSGSRCPKGRLP